MTKHIDHHRAYIRSIVSNELNDLERRPKAPLPLPTDEDGELYIGNVLVNESNKHIPLVATPSVGALHAACADLRVSDGGLANVS